MKLLELFKKQVPFEVVEDTHELYFTSATINGRKVNFEAENMDHKLCSWYVSFTDQVPGGPPRVNMTGNGGEFEVMSFIKDSVLKLISHKGAKRIYFSATKGNARAAVYERMVKRFVIPGWRYTRKPAGSFNVHNTDQFLLIKDEAA